MKKKQLFSAIALGTVLAGCTSDELINKTALENAINADGRISFIKKNTNMTRAASSATNMEKSHYEFGVFGYKGASSYTKDANSRVMENYLVAYGDNSLYSTLAANASTYITSVGNEPTSGSMDDALSTWFYEGLSTSAHATYTTPDVEQALKYWDQGTAQYDFVAYAPYWNQTITKSAATVATEKSIAYNESTDDLVFTNISSFYTGAFDGADVAFTQVSSADGKSTKGYTDEEYINDNEGLFAWTNVLKANYEKDVPFEFKHVNSKINVAFYSAISGYRVEIIDMVPNATTPSGSITHTTNAYNGIAFTPATPAQANWYTDATKTTAQQQPNQKTSPEELPLYLKQGNVTVEDVSAASTTGVSAAGKVTTATVNTVALASNTATTPDNGDAGTTHTTGLTNENLRFDAVTVGDINDKTVDVKTATTVTTKNVIGGTRSEASVSPTTLYVLPNTKYGTTTTSGGAVSGTYITPEYTTSKHYSDNVGYTLHVSYKLIPLDGTASTTIYDARVYVAPEYCHWEAGKAYKYIFKITANTNGTTDLNKADPTDGTYPFVDPSDPRVPEDPALKPIVFDGIYVQDYEENTYTQWTNADGEDDTWLISDASTWNKATIHSILYRTLPATMTGANYKTALNGLYQPVTISNETTPVAADDLNKVTFNGTDLNFTLTYNDGSADDPVSLKYHATANGSDKTYANTEFTGYSSLSAEEQAAVPASLNVPTYTMYAWSNAAGTQAYLLTATPDAPSVAVASTSHTRVYKTEGGNYVAYKETDEHSVTRYYKVTTPSATVPAWINGTNTEFVNTDATEITEVAYEAIAGTDGSPATGTIYKATVTPATTYKVTITGPAAHSGNAYGIAKNK